MVQARTPVFYEVGAPSCFDGFEVVVHSVLVDIAEEASIVSAMSYEAFFNGVVGVEFDVDQGAFVWNSVFVSVEKVFCPEGGESSRVGFRFCRGNVSDFFCVEQGEPQGCPGAVEVDLKSVAVAYF